MDNNPFRSQQQPPTSNTYFPNGQYQQPPQQQPQQQLPYQSMSYTGYQSPTQQQFQSAPQQFQPAPQQFQSTPQQQQWNHQGLDNNSNSSLYRSTSTFNNAYLNNNGSFPQQNSTSSLPSSMGPSTPYSPYSTATNTLPMNQGYNQAMPNPLSYTNTNTMGYPYQQQNDPSNFYIPPNFGVSNTNTYQQQQPRHAPVDASTLLKGTEIRRVECPVCKKMLEGDDMAINHHVNEHYS